MKRITSIAIFIVFCISLCGCSSKWTEEDITKAHTIEITKYYTEDLSKQVVFTITDERTVKNLCNTFSNLKLTDTRISGTTEKAFYIRFIGNGGEIDHITVIKGYNTLQDRHGNLYKIPDEMDIERHLSEIIETVPWERDSAVGSENECVHTFGEWQYDDTYHWCDWTCSLELCDIDTIEEHYDKDENGVCDKCGYASPINSDVTGFNLQKIVFDSLEGDKQTPTDDSEVIDGINSTIKMGSNAYDIIEFCFYYDGNMSEEAFEDMHYSDIIQISNPARMVVRVKHDNLNIEALKMLSHSSQITSIHISLPSGYDVEPEPNPQS